MADLPLARRLRRRGEGGTPQDHVLLGYEERFLRRKRLCTEGGAHFLADLPETASLEHGDAFELEDGRLIGIVAAEEPLLEVRGDLPRLAWHIGNRHTPCRIEADRLLIRRDHVLRGMLEGLGAEVAEVTGPFTPEGGAYGLGRTMGHDHGHEHAHVQHHGSRRHDDEDDDDGEPPVVR